MVSYAKPKLKTSTATIAKQAKSRSQQTRTRGSVWMATRARILSRDSGLCLVCKAAGRLTLASEVDHRTPLEDGGADEDANLQSICPPCHKAKTAAEASARAGR